MAYPFGIDISKYQYTAEGAPPDFAKMRANTSFVAVRAGISWGYKDPTFDQSWTALAGHPRMAYHVVYPAEDAQRQMDNFLNIVKPTQHDRLVMDMELDQGVGKTRITACLLECLEYLKLKTGRYPIVYSRALWINTYVDVSRLPAVDWWLANYLTALPSPQYTPEKTPPPLLPKGVSKWLIHQTGERGNGGAVGVKSYYVDTNRWNGTEAELLAYFGLDEVQPEPEPEPVPIDEALFEARVTATAGLRVRSGAGLSYPVSAPTMLYGTIVEVNETLNGWYRHNKGGWSDSTWLTRQDVITPPIVNLSSVFWGGIFSQRDPRWKDFALGTKSTIEAHGCLMTAVSMVCNHHGHATNPYSLNRWLTDNDGYLDGNLFLWASLERLYPDMIFEPFVYSPTDTQIIEKLQAGILPILYVDFDDATPLIEMHWVLAIGYSGGDIIIADPWSGSIERLRDKYTKPIIRFGYYRRLP